MKELTRRILEICKVKKIKNIDLVNLNCGSPQTVSFVLNGHQKPNSDFLTAMLAEYKDINARWLMTGKGEMLESTSNILEEPMPTYKCNNCIIKDVEIKRLEGDKTLLLDRLERQSEEIGRLKEKLKK